MSGSFQVFCAILKELLEMSEPSPVQAVDGLADPRQTRGWRR